MNILKNRLYLVFIALILASAVFLRFYKLGTNPPELDWDEVAVGYNAWSVLNSGKDEHGAVLPMVFESFGDFKNPIHFYFTIPSILLFGLSEIGVRASTALFGVLNVLMLYLVVEKMFKNKTTALVAALFLAISPWNLQFSRFNHELNFAIFFLLSGVYCFFAGLKNPKLLVISFVLFGLDLITYHSAKIAVPFLLGTLFALYRKELWLNKKYLATGILIFSMFVFVILFVKPELRGGARLSQNAISIENLGKSEWYLKTNDKNLGKLQIYIGRYLKHFTPEYIYLIGDPNPRHSTQTVGILYKTEAFLAAIGILYVLWRLIKKDKQYFVLISWVVISAVPAIFGPEVPHGARSMYATGAYQILSALGVTFILMFIRNKYAKAVAAIVLFVPIAYEFGKYFNNYHQDYAKRYAIEWQYGMKEVVHYVRDNYDKYDEIFMTDEFSQPYIFYLFHLKFPLPKYLNGVKYNTSRSSPSNQVTSFDKFNFGNWNPIESLPTPGILYVITPAKYSGLRYKNSFDTVKVVKYPNGSDAFFLVTAYK